MQLDLVLNASKSYSIYPISAAQPSKKGNNAFSWAPLFIYDEYSCDASKPYRIRLQCSDSINGSETYYTDPFRLNSTSVSSCSAGYYLDGTVCSACAVGTYSLAGAI